MKEGLIAALEQIDWDQLRTHDGTAEAFPDWIMQLTSQDEGWRVEGLEALWRACSPPCPATAYVVPFLLHLLEADESADKDEMLHMLAAFAVTPPANPDEEAARTAVHTGLALCAQFLDSDEATEREAAASVLARFPEEYPIMRTLLRDAITAELDEATRVKMLESYAGLVELVGANPDDALWIAEFAGADQPSTCRLHAALWAARWLCEATPAQVIETLGAAILDPAHFAKYPSELLYAPIVENACEALCKLAPEHALHLLIQLLPLVHDPDDAHILASRMLDLAFHGVTRRYKYASLPEDYPVDRPHNAHVVFRIHKSTPERQASRRRKGRYYPPAANAYNGEPLTGLQQAVLAAIVEADPVWLLHSNLLELVGLPPSRSFARDLIGL